MAYDFDKLLQQFEQNNIKGLPPVQSWQPERAGNIDIVIDKSIQWRHEGTPFERQALVKLLSSILRLEDDGYYLVTPVEKLKISVEDVPFEIVALLPSEQQHGYVMVTNTEDVLPMDAQLHWQLRPYSDEQQIPYVEVRHGLFARVSRSVYYQMVDHAELRDQGDMQQCVFVSDGVEFPLGDLHSDD